MGYLERIQSDLTAAMKEKNELRLSVLRMMKSALKLKEVEKMKPLDDLESLQILQTLVKKGKESVEQFTQGGRPDLAEIEEAGAGAPELQHVGARAEHMADDGIAGPKRQRIGGAAERDRGAAVAVCTENLSSGVVVVKSAKDGA